MMSDLQSVIKHVRQRLYPWQKEYLHDDSDRVIVKKPRQVGYSTIMVLDAFLHAYQIPNHKCFFLSKTVSQARDDTLAIFKDFFLPLFESSGHPFFTQAEVYANRVDLPNGSQLIAEAGNPSKLRGKSRASFYCDEFAHWEGRHLRGIESAISPIVDNNPSSKWKIISTPWDTQSNLFYDIWTNDGGRYSNWSTHNLDIYEAVKCSSFSFDIEEKKREKTPQEWRTEYEGKFLSLSEYFFSKDELNGLWTDHNPPLENPSRYIGIDIGREHDRTSIVTIKRDEDIVVVESVHHMRQERFRTQEGVINSLLQSTDYDECCIDATAHPALAERIEEDFPSVHSLTGDRKRKVNRTNELKRIIDQKNLLFIRGENRLWQEGQWTRCSVSLPDDLCTVKQKITSAGNTTFKVERNSQGHGDSYSALLLALHGEHVNPAAFLGSF
jgi:phage FluMu gp28-like protein